LSGKEEEESAFIFVSASMKRISGWDSKGIDIVVRGLIFKVRIGI